MSSIDEKLRQRVRRGIAVLNAQRPSWTKKISVRRLDLESCNLCVLGQLYDDYDRGLQMLDEAVRSNPVAFGFTTRSLDDAYWERLNKIWAEEIEAQRRARKAAAA